MLGCDQCFAHWRHTCNPVYIKYSFVHRRMELPNSISQVIEFNPNCSEQAHYKSLVLVLGMKTKYIYVFTIHCVKYPLWANL